MHAADITALLSAWREGDQTAERTLITQIYPILLEIAEGQLRRAPGGTATLQATELAHEAYERLCKRQPGVWRDRGHFFAMAATVIRHILVDRLRKRISSKRGGEALVLSIEPSLASEIVQPDDEIDWLELDQALNRLGEAEPVTARVVEMRVFTGLDIEEVANALSISTATVGRHWRFACAFLADHLER